MGAVRELITKVKFQLDKSSEKQANSAIQRLKAKLRSMTGRSAKIKVKADISSAQSSLTKIKGQLKGLNGKTVTTYVRTVHKGDSTKRISAPPAWGSEYEEKLKRKKNALADNGTTLLATGAAMMAPIYFPIKEAMDFESAMADVRKVVDFDSSKEMEAFGEALADMSTKVPMTKEALAQIAAAGGQAGIAKKDLLKFTEDAAKMGIAFDTTAEQAGIYMSKWRTGLKLTQAEVVTLADQVNYLSNNNAATANQISDIILRVGPLANAMGVAGEQTAALGASMVAAGAESEIAATGIQNLLINLKAGANATKSQLAAFAELGLEAEEVAKAMQIDPENTILMVFERIKGLEAYRQGSVVEELIGRESIKSVSTMLSNLDNLKRNFGLVHDQMGYLGSMQKEFDSRSATTANQLQLMKSEFAKTSGEIGADFLPTLNELLKTIQRVTRAFSNFAKEHPKLTQGVLVAVAGFGSLLVVLGGIGLALNGLMTVFEVLTPIIASVGGAFAGISLGPILAILLAIASAIYFIYENWDMVMDFFQPAVESMQEGLEQLAQAWENLQPFIEAIMPLLSFIAQLIGGIIVWALSLLVRAWSHGFNTIATLINMVCSVLGKLGEIIKVIAGGLSGIIDQALEFIGLGGKVSGVNMSAMNSLVPAPSISYGGDKTQNIQYTFTTPQQYMYAKKQDNMWWNENQ